MFCSTTTYNPMDMMKVPISSHIKQSQLLTFPLVGRDRIIGAANGTTSYKGVMYTASAQYIDGLLAPGSNGKLGTSVRFGSQLILASDSCI